MLESLDNYLNELESSAEYTQEFLKKLRGGRTRLVNSINKSEEAVKFARNEVKYVASLKPQVSKLALSAAKDILHGHALQAIRENYEFDAPPYRSGLFLSIEDNDTYLVRSTGAGFKSIIKIDIDLNRTAGRLNLWGSAVKAYRRELKTKVPRRGSKTRESSALQASRAWAGIFGRRAGTNSKFMKTVRGRLSYSPKPAPFWQLLDKGVTPMASDRGGYATPKSEATNFVDMSEKAVNEYISSLIAKEKEKYNQLFSSYETILENAYNGLAELNSLVSEIRLDLKQIQGLDRKAEKAFRDTNISKLEKAVQLIREGLGSTRRLQLAGKGSFRGKRFSIQEVKDLLY